MLSVIFYIRSTWKTTRSFHELSWRKRHIRGAQKMSQKPAVSNRVQKALSSVETFWPGRLDAIQKEQLTALVEQHEFSVAAGDLKRPASAESTQAHAGSWRRVIQATVNRMTAPSLDNASDYVSRAQRDLAKPQKPPVRRPVQGRDSCDIAGDNHRPGGRFHCQSEHTRALEISSSAPHTRAVARPPKVRRPSPASTGWRSRIGSIPSTWTEPSDPCRGRPR